MDSVTHAVLGAAVGELVLGKKLGKKAMLLGAFFSNFSDIDVLTQFYLSPVDALLAHRGFTHSILFVMICIPLFTMLFFRMYKKKAVTYSEWLLFFTITLFSHLLIDIFCAYGTGLFEPFSHMRVSLNTIYVADPFYTFSLLVVTIMLVALNIHSRHRNTVALTGIIVSSLYLIFTFINKDFVNNIVNDSMKNQKLAFNEKITTPTPLNTILWNSIAKNDSGYWIGYYSFLDRSNQMKFYFIPRNDSLIRADMQDERIQKLIRFSQGYYCITQKDSIKYFHDLRFGQTGKFDSKDAPFVFSYALGKSDDTKMSLQKGRFQGSLSETFSNLYSRIKGH
ncbi:MAG: metal-dependent hydrolase [Bacteroidota bacterium]